MTEKFHRPGEQNHAHQRRMANDLVTGLGCREALEFCLEFGWEGITRHILKWCQCNGDTKK